MRCSARGAVGIRQNNAAGRVLVQQAWLKLCERLRTRDLRFGQEMLDAEAKSPMDD